MQRYHFFLLHTMRAYVRLKNTNTLTHTLSPHCALLFYWLVQESRRPVIERTTSRQTSFVIFQEKLDQEIQKVDKEFAPIRRSLLPTKLEPNGKSSEKAVVDCKRNGSGTNIESRVNSSRVCTRNSNGRIIIISGTVDQLIDLLTNEAQEGQNRCVAVIYFIFTASLRFLLT